MLIYYYIKLINLKQLEMLQSLDPFQQLLIGVSSVGILMILLVLFLTASPNFKNTDRFKKIIDSLENKQKTLWQWN